MHTQILEKNGKKQFVVIPYEEFVEIQESLEELEDIRVLKQAKKEEKDVPGIPFDQAMKDLGLE